ncbi:hypothetical protein [Alistipes sp.]|uniref:hypothetical protein n=1 Tax=Alistipes sp. TaxID=1872444 RepID=UPI00352807E8
MKQKLRADFEAAANAYLAAFCKKHGYDFEDARQSWVGGRVGEITEVADLFIDLRDIRTDIDHDAPKDEFVKWYDYCLRLSMIDHEILIPNYEHWLMGCPRKSEEEIAKLERLARNVKEAREALRYAVKSDKTTSFKN